jgi:thiamine biosynthesis lipoprotein
MRAITRIVSILALALFAADTQPAVGATARSGNVVMGTVLEVTVVAAEQETADALLRGAFEEARHWDDVLTTWRPDGELARLNASGGAIFDASKELRAAFGIMRKFSFLTGGAFDPAVGPIVERWRRGDPKPGPREGESRDIYRIRTASDLMPDGIRLRRGAALDSGGIGKGIALDAIAASFGNRAEAFYLDFGGSSQTARGKPENGAPSWKVVVAGDVVGKIHGTVVLDGASISTSRALDSGNAAGAIIDPTTLVPVRPSRLATVIARDATTAEAWSTALVVLGARGIKMAEAAKIDAFLEIDGEIQTTPGFPIEPVP